MPEFLFGTPQRFVNRDIYNKGQQQAFADVLKRGQQNIANPLQGFDAIRNRANTRYNQETIPALLERFAASGNNASSSGALKSQLSGSAADLQERLAALESQYGMQREGLGLQQLGLGLTPQQETILLGGDQGALKGIAGGLGTGLGMAAPYLLQNWLTGGKGGDMGATDGASNFAGDVGTAATIGSGAFKGISALGASAAPYALPLAAGAAGLYGLYRLLSYLKSQRKPEGQQQLQTQPMEGL